MALTYVLLLTIVEFYQHTPFEDLAYTTMNNVCWWIFFIILN